MRDEYDTHNVRKVFESNKRNVYYHIALACVISRIDSISILSQL